ncbi:MAG TPA: hypothetical protein VFS43_38215, partial [Polyangiaceae bacterium]|nr:hypothetical protein [Polyangiaceae bacterium]
MVGRRGKDATGSFWPLAALAAAALAGCQALVTIDRSDIVDEQFNFPAGGGGAGGEDAGAAGAAGEGGG